MVRGLLASFGAAFAVLVFAPAALAADVPRWCGLDRVATDRPDAVGAFQIHVVYAVPSDGSARFDELVLPIARELAAIDEWWRAQDSSRAPRFDLFAGACDSTFGLLDVSNVRLPNGAGHYADAGSQHNRLRDDLVAAGFAELEKKYLVFYDGPVNQPQWCGTGTIWPDGGRFGYASVYLGSYCAIGLGGGTNAAALIAHELVHALGALGTWDRAASPPNLCAGDRTHPCDRADDVLSATVEDGVPLNHLQLDVGRDDYYDHPGAWWDVKDSLFLWRTQIADQSSPNGPESITATSGGGVVTVTWPPASDASPLRYRVYQDGALVVETAGRSFRETAADGEIVSYAVRAADVHGLLGPRQAIRFKVGHGIVDDAGRLVRDTVPPGEVASVVVRRKSKLVVRLQWSAAHELAGLRGYRLFRNGQLFRTVRARFLDVPRRLSGTWRVQAVDTAGNVGPFSYPVRVR